VTDPTRPSGYDHRRDEVRTLWDQGLSAPKIAGRTGVPAYRVRILLEQSGVDLSNTAVHHRGNQAAHLPRLRELIEGGATVKEAAEALDQRYTTVLGWVRRAGIEVGPNEREVHLAEVLQGHRRGRRGRRLHRQPVAARGGLRAVLGAG